MQSVKVNLDLSLLRSVAGLLDPIDLEQLRMLEGHLGVPKMSLDKEKKESRPPKPKGKDKEQEEE